MHVGDNIGLDIEGNFNAKVLKRKKNYIPSTINVNVISRDLPCKDVE